MKTLLRTMFSKMQDVIRHWTIPCNQRIPNAHCIVLYYTVLYTVIHKKRDSTFVIITLEKLVWFLSANVNSCSRSLYAIARPSVCRLSVKRSCALLRRLKFSAIFLRHLDLVPWPPLTSTESFTEIVPSVGGVKHNRGTVAKYSDFGPIEGYISETVQDRK